MCSHKRLSELKKEKIKRDNSFEKTLKKSNENISKTLNNIKYLEEKAKDNFRKISAIL